jgi:diguanylate cyclase (GGDEF)-like protein
MFSSEQLAEILTALPDPAFILTRSGRYAGIFGGSDSRYYHDGSNLVGLSISDVIDEEKTAWFLAQIDQALNTRKLSVVEYGLAGSDIKGLPPEGPQDIIHFEGRIQALGFQVDGEDAVLWVASNISQRHKLEEQLRALSETDSLTGLRNRRHFEKIVDAEKERAQRYEVPVSLLIFDIDHFKVINDTYGHNAGDAVLSELAKVVCGCTRESDIVARWGGEEFAILMPYASLHATAEVAEKIRQKIEAHQFPLGHKVTISIGVAEWSLATETFNTLLSRADDALYRAKRSGRNRSVLSLPELVRPSSKNAPRMNTLF